MNKVTNTSESPRVDWLFGGNPNAILNQEAQGQKEIVNSSQLPVDCNTNGIEIEKQYEGMGIKVLGKTKGDEIFFDVEMPKGWRKACTDHSMWNKLLDDKGRIRANFFYKAAFYDRSSHIDFCTRYQVKEKYFDNEKNPNKGWDCAREIQVLDTSNGAVLFATDKHFVDRQSELYDVAKTWLTKSYPDWQNVNAYWD